MVAHLAFVRLFLNLQLPDEALESWLRVYVAGTVLGGIAWGALGLLFSITPSLPHQVFTFRVLAGMCVGALSSHVALLTVYLAFLIPSLLPLMGWQLSRGDQIDLGVDAVTALLGTALIVIARGHHRSVWGSREMRRENLSLVDALGARNRELLRSNESHDVLCRLLELSLESRPIGTRLETALDIICSVTWIRFNSKAAISLADDSGQTLELIASERDRAVDEMKLAASVFDNSLRGIMITEDNSFLLPPSRV